MRSCQLRAIARAGLTVIILIHISRYFHANCVPVSRENTAGEEYVQFTRRNRVTNAMSEIAIRKRISRTVKVKKEG